MKTTTADKYFSLFIRIRDAHDGYIGRCSTCGRVGNIKKMDCGHYIKRQFSATRFSEENCHLQCKNCNNFLQGNDTKFKEYITAKHGEKTVLLLEASKRQSVKRSANDLKQLADYYKKKAIELARGKGIEIW